MRIPDKSFTKDGKKYRRVVNGEFNCDGCCFFHEKQGCTEAHNPQSEACLFDKNSDKMWSIWVEVKPRVKNQAQPNS